MCVCENKETKEKYANIFLMRKRTRGHIIVTLYEESYIKNIISSKR